MDWTACSIGMHVKRISNGSRGVIVGAVFTGSEGEVTAPIFFRASGTGHFIRSGGWWVRNFEPDPEPPEDLWALYVAALLRGDPM